MATAFAESSTAGHELEKSMRSLSIDSDVSFASSAATEESIDETPTPPLSPPAAATPAKSLFVFDNENVFKPSGLATPPASASAEPESPTKTPLAAAVAARQPLELSFAPHGRAASVPCESIPSPSSRKRYASVASDTSPSGGLAARRAASGKLPDQALLFLSKMKFENNVGLNIGPNSAAIIDDGELTPRTGAFASPGLAFRTALGLADKENGSPAGSPAGTPLEEKPLASPSVLGDAHILRQKTGSLLATPPTSSRSRLLASPSTSPDAVKIPPSLIGSKLLEKTSLATPVSNAKARHMGGYAASPPSPLVLRSSAGSYFQQLGSGPMTPLTPGQQPGAPALTQKDTFDWGAFTAASPMASPSGYASPSIASIFAKQRDGYFPDTPPTDLPPMPETPTKIPFPFKVNAPLARMQTGTGSPLPSPSIESAALAANPFFVST